MKLYTHHQLEASFRAGYTRREDLIENPGFVQWSRGIEGLEVDKSLLYRAEAETKTGITRYTQPLTPTAVVTATSIATHMLDGVEGISYAELVAPSGGFHSPVRIALPRMVSIYLCYLYTGWSYPKLAKFYGGRNHSGLVYSVKSVAGWKDSDKQVKALLGATHTILLDKGYAVVLHEDKIESYEKLTTK